MMVVKRWQNHLCQFREIKQEPLLEILPPTIFHISYLSKQPYCQYDHIGILFFPYFYYGLLTCTELLLTYCFEEPAGIIDNCLRDIDALVVSSCDIVTLGSGVSYAFHRLTSLFAINLGLMRQTTKAPCQISLIEGMDMFYARYLI